MQKATDILKDADLNDRNFLVNYFGILSSVCSLQFMPLSFLEE